MIEMVWSTLEKAAKYLFKRPYTRMVPKSEPPFKTDHTRGRHILDLNKCTGCSLCKMVCPANAIDMERVEVEEGKYPQNKKKIFPRIDFHKCTYCGLCVEYCPFSALLMTNVTGFELFTTDKSTTLKHPQELAIPPKNRYRVTITRAMFSGILQKPQVKAKRKGGNHG